MKKVKCHYRVKGIQRPNTKLLHIQNRDSTPVLQYSSTPSSGTPVLQYSILRDSSTPVLQYSETPVLQYSNHSTIQPFNHPTIQSSNHSTLLSLLTHFRSFSLTFTPLHH